MSLHKKLDLIMIGNPSILNDEVIGKQHRTLREEF